MLELDNILVRQKNAIIEKINDGEFLAALHSLEIVRELWIESNYSYKVDELVRRIEEDDRLKMQSVLIASMCKRLKCK
jgi:hypothetical protein